MLSPKMKRVLSERARKQWQNEEYKKYMTQKFLEFYNSNAEYREKNNQLLNKSQKEYWSSDVNKQKQSVRTREYFRENPDKKIILSEISKKQWQDETLLLWRSDKTKAQWTPGFREKRKRAYNRTYLTKGLQVLKSIYEKRGVIDESAYNEKRKEIGDRSIIKLSTIKKRFFIAGLIALILNIIWEFSHHFLYVDLSGIPKYSHLIIASFADMVIILGIFAIVSLKNKNLNWIKNPSKFDYFMVVFLGLIIAIFIEMINLNLGRWEYTLAMPTLFGIGISPLIQLALTGIISLIFIKQIK